MPHVVSNERDLLLAFLAELLFVERRLAGEVLPALVREVRDDELKAALEAHLGETKEHVERLETAFRRLEAAPSANLSRAFEGAVQQHDLQAPDVLPAELRDVFHTAAAVHTEHFEIASYRTIISCAAAAGFGDAIDGLAASLAEEEHARETLEALLPRLAAP